MSERADLEGRATHSPSAPSSPERLLETAVGEVLQLIARKTNARRAGVLVRAPQDEHLTVVEIHDFVYDRRIPVAPGTAGLSLPEPSGWNPQKTSLLCRTSYLCQGCTETRDQELTLLTLPLVASDEGLLGLLQIECEQDAPQLETDTLASLARLAAPLLEARHSALPALARANCGLKDALAASARASRQKSEMIADVSHEVRSSLHAISSFARIGIRKGDKVPPERLVGYFEEISESCDRLLPVVNSVLDLSKFETQRSNGQKLPNDMVKVVLETVSEFQASLEEARLSARVEHGTPTVEASFDRSCIMQVMRNLIANACKFANAGTEIIIRVDLDPLIGPSHVLVSVSDVGLTLSPEDLETLFNRFVQAHNTPSNAQGSGLGLAISKRIVEEHGGTIWAECRNDEVRFSFRIPLIQSDKDARNTP